MFLTAHSQHVISLRRRLVPLVSFDMRFPPVGLYRGQQRFHVGSQRIVNVRFRSLADTSAGRAEVRCTPTSRH